MGIIIYPSRLSLSMNTMLMYSILSLWKSIIVFFENIGTGDNCLIKSQDLEQINQAKSIYENLKNAYLQKYLNKKYNALLYMVSSENIMYDYSVSRFVNRNQIFYDKKTNNTVYVYEEDRQVNNYEYENTIYDRVVHKDFDDWEDLLAYFNIEPTFMLAEVSIFDYYRDRRIKYMQFFDYPIGPFNDSYYKYISKDFTNAIDLMDATTTSTERTSLGTLCMVVLYNWQYIEFETMVR